MTQRIIAVILLAACSTQSATTGAPSGAERDAIAQRIEQRLKTAYDLAQPDVVPRFLSLYPPGRGTPVISASGGRVTASRDTLEMSVRSFWEGVGQYMREPRWEWGPMHVEVLSRDAAVLTTTYAVPHRTEENVRHVIGGAWTSVWRLIDGEWYIVREHLSDMPRAAAERIEREMRD
jgi:hypothetical protein